MMYLEAGGNVVYGLWSELALKTTNGNRYITTIIYLWGVIMCLCC